MSIQNIFTDRIETFLRDYGVTASRFGADVVGDPCFVSDIREGRSCSLRTVDKVMKYIDAYKKKAQEDDQSSLEEAS